MKPRMAVFRDVVEIKDPWNRAIKVMITAPDVSRFRDNPEEVQVLAQKAWKSVNKCFTFGDMTVKVEGFGR
jgi:hypothetical protein